MGGVRRCNPRTVRSGQEAGRVEIANLLIVVTGSRSPTQTKAGAEQLGLLLACCVVVAASAPGKVDLLVGDGGAAAVYRGVPAKVGPLEAGE